MSVAVAKWSVLVVFFMFAMIGLMKDEVPKTDMKGFSFLCFLLGMFVATVVMVITGTVEHIYGAQP